MGGCGALCRCGCARTYEGTQFLCVKFRLGSAGGPTICSHMHCYCVPYMKIPANNQVLLKWLTMTVLIGLQWNRKIDTLLCILDLIVIKNYINGAICSSLKICWSCPLKQYLWLSDGIKSLLCCWCLGSFSCVITNCGQHQRVIPSLSIAP